MKASDLFVKALEAEHVEYVFGIPGEENLDLLESLRTSSIKLILTRHEQAAGFMDVSPARPVYAWPHSGPARRTSSPLRRTRNSAACR
jgi:glyoxylate carboligase